MGEMDKEINAFQSLSTYPFTLYLQDKTMLDVKKLLKKSSVVKNMGSSMSIISVCFRIIKQTYNISECNGYIRHNILFVSGLPRDIAIKIYRDKAQILGEINQELLKFDFRYTMKNIITK